MKSNYENIDELLKPFKKVLNTDYEIYRNHVYRIYNYCILLDNLPENSIKYQIAAVYHDIGIWTHSFDYLEPSIKLVTDYLIKSNQKELVEEITLMIDNHHKISAYSDKFTKTVEVFRKADWIDVSMGLLRFNLEKAPFIEVRTAYSVKGFHWFLVKQFLKYFIKHPLHPLPMFKK